MTKKNRQVLHQFYKQQRQILNAQYRVIHGANLTRDKDAEYKDLFWLEKCYEDLKVEANLPLTDVRDLVLIPGPDGFDAVEPDLLVEILKPDGEGGLTVARSFFVRIYIGLWIYRRLGTATTQKNSERFKNAADFLRKMVDVIAETGIDLVGEMPEEKE